MPQTRAFPWAVVSEAVSSCDFRAYGFANFFGDTRLTFDDVGWD
jgi:hypothetical protein